jgi:hypothetical protein
MIKKHNHGNNCECGQTLLMHHSIEAFYSCAGFGQFRSTRLSSTMTASSWNAERGVCVCVCVSRVETPLAQTGLHDSCHRTQFSWCMCTSRLHCILESFCVLSPGPMKTRPHPISSSAWIAAQPSSEFLGEGVQPALKA